MKGLTGDNKVLGFFSPSIVGGLLKNYVIFLIPLPVVWTKESQSKKRETSEEILRIYIVKS